MGLETNQTLFRHASLFFRSFIFLVDRRALLTCDRSTPVHRPGLEPLIHRQGRFPPASQFPHLGLRPRSPRLHESEQGRLDFHLLPSWLLCHSGIDQSTPHAPPWDGQQGMRAIHIPELVGSVSGGQCRRPRLLDEEPEALFSWPLLCAFFCVSGSRWRRGPKGISWLSWPTSITNFFPYQLCVRERNLLISNPLPPFT